MRTCRNVPASPDPYWAQDGWHMDESGMTRKPRMKLIHHVMSTGCKYDKQATDTECAGCERRNKGEAE